MLGYIILLSVLSPSVGAADVCCAPDKWFAQRFTAGLALSKVEGVPVPFADAGSSVEYYDAANERLAIISNYSIDNKHGESKVIADHKEGLLYTINLKKSVCIVQKLNLKFAKFCVTDKFKKAFDFSLGFGSNSLQSTIYYERDRGFGPHPESEIDSFVVVSKECIPIQTDIYGRDDYNILQSTGFANLGGEFDESVFDPPDFCPTCSQSSITNTSSVEEIPLLWKSRANM
ncbi:ependymin-related protein 2-like [Haliotis asinina]|uniref:ependymin-related protein 2-like n=1 Tax=Haliotis asinina TaxID=109174 RepID=UPI003531C59D